MLPSSRLATPSFSAMTRRSSFLPLNEKLDVRPVTRRCLDLRQLVEDLLGQAVRESTPGPVAADISAKGSTASVASLRTRGPWLQVSWRMLRGRSANMPQHAATSATAAPRPAIAIASLFHLACAGCGSWQQCEGAARPCHTNAARQPRNARHAGSSASPSQCDKSAVCFSSNMMGRLQDSIITGTSLPCAIRLRCLRTHPAGVHRLLRPQHHDGLRVFAAPSRSPRRNPRPDCRVWSHQTLNPSRSKPSANRRAVAWSSRL